MKIYITVIKLVLGIVSLTRLTGPGCVNGKGVADSYPLFFSNLLELNDIYDVLV